MNGSPSMVRFAEIFSFPPQSLKSKCRLMMREIEARSADWPRSLELRTKLARVPAKVLHCRGGIEDHVLHHAIAHGNIRIGNERTGQRECGSPECRRNGDYAPGPVQSVKDASNHLAIRDRLPPGNCIDLVDRRRTNRGRERPDRQIFCVNRLTQARSAPRQGHEAKSLDQPRKPRDIGIETLVINDGWT